VIEKVLETFVSLRQPEERFLDTFRRVGMDPFKERAYA
jgi:sulfite reductase (NADPH) hemoprotein beta-component